MNIADIKALEFSPCTGFGADGRAVTVRMKDGSTAAGGYGADDAEAIVETLTANGWTFDTAFDAVGDVLALVNRGVIAVVRA